MPKVEVVDTNVWANIDKLPPENAIEANCILACLKWSKAFINGGDDYQLAVDMRFKILNEYRGQIKQGGLAERYLNELLSQPITRLRFVSIEYDEDGIAKLDKDLIDDPSDRKFVAVALKFDPIPTIINATDTDWEKSKEKLSQAGINVQELCPTYISSKLTQK